MHWGHAVSTDLLHWEYLPCALAPDSPADNGPGCFSGSATEMDDGKQLLMYTSVVAEKQPNGEMRDIQTQSIAIGDGLDYEKPACNPVLTQKDLPEGFSKFDFRDPKIWREADGTLPVVTVCRAEDDSGAAALFQSADGFDWHFVTVLERCNNQYGKMWECPDFFPLDGKQVLMLGPMEMLPKGEFHNGHNVIAFIGSYDQATHTFTKENVQLMDGGIDFYATQTTLAPDGRRIMTAWLQTWSDTEDKPQGCKWFGQTICPRELHIKDGRIVQTPVRELDAVHGKRTLPRKCDGARRNFSGRHQGPCGRPDRYGAARRIPLLYPEAGRRCRPPHQPDLRPLHFRADAGSQLCRFPCRHRSPPQLQGPQPERCAQAPHPAGQKQRGGLCQRR